jgi:hypothetical protein
MWHALNIASRMGKTELARSLTIHGKKSSNTRLQMIKLNQYSRYSDNNSPHPVNSPATLTVKGNSHIGDLELGAGNDKVTIQDNSTVDHVFLGDGKDTVTVNPKYSTDIQEGYDSSAYSTLAIGLFTGNSNADPDTVNFPGSRDDYVIKSYSNKDDNSDVTVVHRPSAAIHTLQGVEVIQFESGGGNDHTMPVSIKVSDLKPQDLAFYHEPSAEITR